MGLEPVRGATGPSAHPAQLLLARGPSLHGSLEAAEQVLDHVVVLDQLRDDGGEVGALLDQTGEEGVVLAAVVPAQRSAEPPAVQQRITGQQVCCVLVLHRLPGEVQSCAQPPVHLAHLLAPGPQLLRTHWCTLVWPVTSAVGLAPV